MATKVKRRTPPKLSRQHQPEHLTLEEWQTELRRQFGRSQKFRLRNLGEEPVFSEFAVTNPQSRSSYRVTIRGSQPGDNACTCGDFVTNTLGTCKHVEFTLGVLERKHGRKALAAAYQPRCSEVYLQYGHRRVVRFRPGRDCPAELARLAGRWFDDEGCLAADRVAELDDFLSRAAANESELRVTDDVLAFAAEVRDAAARQARLRELFPRGTRSAAFNKLLRVPLYEYQREGALFAARAGRCLIGDEMGLGKTVQAIAAVEILTRVCGVERVLVVCPTSLKHQWQREIDRFAGREAAIIGGMRPAREAAFASESLFKIMNYDTVHRDLDLIRGWSPDVVILDEAQRIKNWSTRTARSVKQIVSPYAIVLTGTPLENRLEELVSIVQFVDRHRLGPTFRLLDEHQVRDEVGRVVGYRGLDKLGQSLASVLIRRSKSAVLAQMPDRIDQTLFVPMTDAQRELHDENRDIVAKIVAKWRRCRFLSERDQRLLMIALQNMRMSCDSSYLVNPPHDFGHKADELAILLGELLEEPDTKVVVFSQWVRMHELIVRRLAERGWGHVLFHGGVPGPKRKDLIERFRGDPDCRLFLSTDAGGVGLNLQFASVVVNMDLPWNPAVLEQRVGRVHRLGQSRPVRVVNLVAQGTIEQGMLGLLDFKRGLFAGVLDGGAPQVMLGGSRLNRFMDTVEKATGEIPTADAAEEPEAPEPPAAGPDDPWRGLAEVGRALLDRLHAPATAGNGQRSLIERDPKSGTAYLRLPVPPPHVLQPALQALGALLKAWT